MRTSEFKTAALSVAPTLSAVSALVGGMVLLASGATPTDPERLGLLLRLSPEALIDASHFVSSLLGLFLILLAFGLRARLGAAWMGAVTCLAVAAALAPLKGLNVEETGILVLLLALVAPFRSAFTRTARLSRMEITPGWLLSAAAAVAGAGLLGWWSFSNADYGDRQVWRMMFDADIERAIRSSVGAGVLLLAVGVWRLFATAATPGVAGEDDPDFARVRCILGKAESAEPESNLALLGDKRFLFSASGETFLMFGVRGRSWVAMGPPVGRRNEHLELLWKFREMADAHAARPCIYALEPEDLVDVVELGFHIQKTGESASVPLQEFTLAGRRREVLRRNWRKAGESGATFEVAAPGEAPMDQLQRISDAWLKTHSGGEKSFSLGGFIPRYVAEFPVALVRSGGQIVAFATLWPTASRTSLSMDLMRYGEDAPKNIMDFLFVELLTWGREQGYLAFDFGVAPLAGLEDRPLAPILSRVGRLLFERGEEFYNFRGVRRYKDKYDPLWRPRYMACPHKWQVPFLLADVGLLSSGGMTGLGRRPRKETPARPAPDPCPEGAAKSLELEGQASRQG
ncbi:MAG: bifunctional lysylphosphatidylglycerol flippase/synthetase MprF [Caulobacter sp.]|nr:bifunctional lysylphosphatidylglycerol flippase/synthetase MprF [Caulobacter sp.]